MSVIELLTNPTSKVSPAMVRFQGIVYSAWTAVDKERIYLGWQSGEGPVASWIGDQSHSGPGLATDGKKFFVGWTSLNDKDFYVSTTSDGVKFSRKQIGERTPYTPALTLFKSEIYAAFVGDSKKVYVKKITAKGELTTKEKNVTVGTTGVSGPTLAVYKDTLYVAWPQADGTCTWVTSSDGVNFSARQTMSTSSALTPSLAATTENIYLVWTAPDQAIQIRSLDGKFGATVATSASEVGPAAIGVDTELFILWTRPDDNLTLFSYGVNAQEHSHNENLPRGEDYIKATPETWGFKVDFSHRAVDDIVSGLNVISSISGALTIAGATLPQVTVIGGCLAAVTRAGSTGLGLLDKNKNGVSVYVPWTALVPIPPPVGPGGIVFPWPR
jgi:hypothetical protein